MKHSAEARAVRRGAMQELALIIPITLLAMATAGTLTHHAVTRPTWYHTWNR